MRSSRTMLPKKSSVSRRNASRRSLSKSGNSSVFGAMFCRLRTCSHWPAKFSTSASAFGSASMRRTCASSTAGWRRRPAAARSSSASSGMLLQRKNDSRDASSMSLTRYAAPARHRGRILFDAEDERRARQQAAQRELDAGVEAALLAAVAIERPSAAPGRRRSPDAGRRAAASVGQDPPRAAALSARAAGARAGTTKTPCGGSACRPGPSG